MTEYQQALAAQSRFYAQREATYARAATVVEKTRFANDVAAAAAALYAAGKLSPKEAAKIAAKIVAKQAASKVVDYAVNKAFSAPELAERNFLNLYGN